MSAIVDRIQNYYQYNDAEAKYYQLLKSDIEEVKCAELPKIVEAPSEPSAPPHEIKSKKSKKNKKKSVSEEVAVLPPQPQPVVESKKKLTKSAESKDDDTSAKTDSGIVDEPAATLSTVAAAKKKSKSKKQKEKKAAAAALAAQQQQQAVDVPKEPETKENIVIDLTPATVSPTVAAAASIVQSLPTKPKDKKKKSKNSSVDKSKENEEKNGVSAAPSATSSLVSEIEKARQKIKTSLERVDGASSGLTAPVGIELLDRISNLEKDNQQLRGLVESMQKLVISLEGRLNGIECKKSAPAAKVPEPAAEADDDDVDLFGSDDEEETAEAERIKEERVKAYTEKKSKKPALIAKSSILLDVKPWDDETDMKEMERLVRTIQMEGLLWAQQARLVPLAYGINKLQIGCVIEDEKVSVDELQEKITEFEDYVQSVDIAAFNKI